MRRCQVLVAPLANVGHVGIEEDWTDLLNIVGTIQPAVEVTFHAQVGYIWNDSEMGWWKVTEGKGLDSVPHYGLTIALVVAYDDDLELPIIGGLPLGGLLP